jgi:radical SAM superfamily enzyme YgiQ (UPF0313 family)
MPLGLLYIGATLRTNNIDCLTLDAEANRLGISDIMQIAASHKPRLIGLNCHTLNRWNVYQLASALKVVQPEALVMLGGAHPTLAPVSTLRECPQADGIVVGEGESTFLDIARSSGDLSGIRGLYVRHGEQVASTGRRARIEDLDALPYPDLSGADLTVYLDYENVDLPGLWKRAALSASRGCAYRCSFCTEWSFWGASNSHRTAASVMDEVERYVSRYHVRRFQFYDDTFTDWPDFGQFCESAAAHDVLWGCSTRIDQLTPATIELLSQGGCREIAVGLESGSPAILESVSKGWESRVSHDQIAATISACAGAGIKIRAHFIIGFPWETREDITETVKFALGLRDHMLADANFFTAKAYPGTTFATRLLRGHGGESDLTEAWSVHDADSTRNPLAAAKLSRFNDISRYSLHPHLDSLSVRALARRAWELFFSEANAADVGELLWEGISWQT